MKQPPEYPGRERMQRVATRNSAGGAYEGAFEAVGAILVATLLGYWFDEYFETTPIGLLAGAVIGFGAFVLRLVRLGRQLHPEASAASAETPTSPRSGDEGESEEGPGSGSGTGTEIGLSDVLDFDGDGDSKTEENENR